MRERRRGAAQGWHEKWVVETRAVSSAARRDLYLIATALMVAGVVLFMVVLRDVLQNDDLSTIDEPIVGWLGARRSDELSVAMNIVAVVFGPIVLPIAIVVITLAWGFFARHAWRPLLLSGGMAAGLVLVQVLTRLVRRERPPLDLMLFGTDTTFSFPSGHVMGAADILFLGAYLVFSRRTNPLQTVAAFVLAGALVLLAAVSRVYLGFHWPTDAIASFALSLVVLGGVIAVDTLRTVRIRDASPLDPHTRRADAGPTASRDRPAPWRRRGTPE